MLRLGRDDLSRVGMPIFTLYTQCLKLNANIVPWRTLETFSSISHD